MNSSDEPIEFFRFLKYNAALFTICALFAAFHYYVVTLLRDPKIQLNAYNITELNKNYLKLSPQVKGILDQIFSLELAAVISFLIFGIILISIIIIAFRYDIYAKFFAILLASLLYFSFIYLLSSFKQPLYSFIIVFIPIILFFGYSEVIDFLFIEYRKNHLFDFGLYWYLMFDTILILIVGAIGLLNIFSTFEPSEELTFFTLFLVFLTMTLVVWIPLHIFVLIKHLKKNVKKRTLSEFSD